MKMNFIHAVVFDKDEFGSCLSSNLDLTDWGVVCDGDYVVHCLYSLDNEEVVILDDNTHSTVEDMIENFIEGIEYTGYEAYVDKAYVVLNDRESPYSDEDVCRHLNKGEYVEVM